MLNLLMISEDRLATVNTTKGVISVVGLHCLRGFLFDLVSDVRKRIFFERRAKYQLRLLGWHQNNIMENTTMNPEIVQTVVTHRATRNHFLMYGKISK